MKVSCGVIKDLLPLYHDNVCSSESIALVEEHISQCINCKLEIQDMNRSLPFSIKQQNIKEAETVQKLSKRWKKGMLKSLLKGILITAIVIVVVFFILYLFVDFQFIPKSY